MSLSHHFDFDLIELHVAFLGYLGIPDLYPHLFEPLFQNINVELGCCVDLKWRDLFEYSQLECSWNILSHHHANNY